MNAQMYFYGELAPIVLFVFNRPEHTRRTIESLSRNFGADKSDLIIFSDAAKSPSQERDVDSVRSYLEKIVGFNTVSIKFRDTNYGLSRSIIEGVSDVLKKYHKVIVLEDDMVTSPFFIKYMNEALNIYTNINKVASVHGYVYPTKKPLPETFFLRGADCWGWGTWRRSWLDFISDGKFLLDQLKKTNQINEFNFNGAFPFARMLQDQIEGRNDSWAIRWHATCFLNNKLTLYPGRSLIENIGHDGSGTHSGSDGKFKGRLTDSPILVLEKPVKVSSEAWSEFQTYLAGNYIYIKKINYYFKRLMLKLLCRN